MTRKSDAILDLDALEREDAPEPFPVKLNGKQYVMTDPRNVSWETLSAVRSDNRSYLAATVSDKERAEFDLALSKLPGWKIEELAKRYNEHHGLLGADDTKAADDA